MHKCINKSVGNVYHLEQLVDNFFPYSQKQLGFDKPCSIIFQSDKKNSQRMLGKTAYYDPTAHEVYLYIDGRHPKDVMRSLSHELVHHAQNCRGDFTGAEDTGPGYAQNNPHMRKMEREAYTKGNLIFRDFEDLIKTGKITIDIDFKKSGEPKMSLKEWKNNELNMLMMKKWGLLKEDSGKEEHDHAEANIHDDKEHIKDLKRDVKDDEKELEEGHVHGSECGCPEDEMKEGGMRYRGEDEPEEGAWGKTHRHDDPLAALSGEDYEGIEDPDVVNIKGDQFGMGDKFKAGGAMGGSAAKEKLRRGPRARRRHSTGPGMALGPRFEGTDKKMISVKEAKRLTQQIIERYLAEKK